MDKRDPYLEKLDEKPDRRALSVVILLAFLVGVPVYYWVLYHL